MDIAIARQFAIGAHTHLERALSFLTWQRQQPNSLETARFDLGWAVDDLRRTSQYLRETNHWDRDLVTRLESGAKAAEAAIANLIHHAPNFYEPELRQAAVDAETAMRALWA